MGSGSREKPRWSSSGGDGFARNPDARFEAEEMIVSGDRAVVRWVYRKMRNGQPWHIRGVDVFTVRDGKVAAKLAYVKG